MNYDILFYRTKKDKICHLIVPYVSMCDFLPCINCMIVTLSRGSINPV